MARSLNSSIPQKYLHGGELLNQFCRLRYVPCFPKLPNTGYRKIIKFLFDGCHHSFAAETYDKSESDLKLSDWYIWLNQIKKTSFSRTTRETALAGLTTAKRCIRKKFSKWGRNFQDD